MSNDNDILRTSDSSFRLRADALALMLKGGGYAALFCGALLVIWFVLVGIGALLPPESKEADDPNPNFSMVVPEAERTFG
ncbi:RC-LH1 core complex protein PufX [Roseovarius sp. LXJ103]|uniref:RC-LH1 core complex protein PufX n=1 Tax=Roseovarius carneus TaxID=2853164 RepID=UPI000D60DF49|nr:RC-LH1 core complex protein PufX [Roseovarius carneus]MBZ8119136.1 RC-LH1 core complex protein PufX [Roseovarius carneus]PWE35231.1 hypothetical protein DD563_04165 [Pelagicola sp. LXJ1103]